MGPPGQLGAGCGLLKGFAAGQGDAVQQRVAGEFLFHLVQRPFLARRRVVTAGVVAALAVMGTALRKNRHPETGAVYNGIRHQPEQADDGRGFSHVFLPPLCLWRIFRPWCSRNSRSCSACRSFSGCGQPERPIQGYTPKSKCPVLCPYFFLSVKAGTIGGCGQRPLQVRGLRGYGAASPLSSPLGASHPCCGPLHPAGRCGLRGCGAASPLSSPLGASHPCYGPLHPAGRCGLRGCGAASPLSSPLGASHPCYGPCHRYFKPFCFSSLRGAEPYRHSANLQG